MIDFQPALDAKLKPVDLSRLLHVNRVTVSRWLNDHTQPHLLLEKRVVRLLDIVKVAVKAGDLPVPNNVAGAERRAYIQRVLNKHISERNVSA